MKKSVIRVLPLFWLAALLASAAQAQSALPSVDLPRFVKVTDSLYRGAQPTEEGFRRLKELGIKTIINLRAEDELGFSEKEAVERLGLRYHNVALPGLSRPGDEQVARVMGIIEAPENGPVFIHCRRGSDRTGTIAAIYRISHEGWTADQALAEAKRNGLSWAEFGMRRYISDYYERQVKSKPIGASVNR
jgi:protein tyrosine/serine phosphatase